MFENSVIKKVVSPFLGSKKATEIVFQIGKTG
jgi:hypothetical protein